jgi:hypothetical protein
MPQSTANIASSQYCEGQSGYTTRRTVAQLYCLRCFMLSCLYFSVIPLARAQGPISLPQGQVGMTYSTSIKTEGGLAPLEWRLAKGELPPGLRFSENGKVEGKPTAAKRDAYSFTVSVSDSSQPRETTMMEFSIVIRAAQLRITGVAQEAATLRIVGVAAVDDPAALPAIAVAPATGASAPSAQQSAQNPCASGQLPFWNRPPKAGEVTLDGCAEIRGIAAVQVGVLPAGSSLTCADPSKYPQNITARLLPGASGATTVEFLANLPSPLVGGQLVCIAEMTSANVVVKTSQPHPVPNALTTSPSACASAKELPTIVGTLVNGQTTLIGCTEAGFTGVEISIDNASPQVACSNLNPNNSAQKSSTYLTNQSPGDSFAQFSAQIGPLKTGQQVCLIEIDKNNSPGKVMSSPSVVKSEPEQTVQTCESTSTAYFPEPPVTGRKVISGCAGQAPGVRVLVYANESKNPCPTIFSDPSQPGLATVIDNVSANVDHKTGIFQAELANALSDNELICAYSVGADQNPPVVVTKWGYEEPNSFMGRTRYYLSTGVELSQDNQQFSNQDLYLGFALDRNWIRGAPDAWLTRLLNSEFSAQLTSIPVAASSTTTTSSTTSQSVSTFITSRKAAVVGGDIYAPLYFRAFKGWFGSQTTAFFAPIIKGGLQTITSGALSASTPAPGTTTATTTINSEGLYYFWGMGIRLGDLKLHRSWNVGPEILSHLDLTFGQWQNFEQCKHASSCTPGADGTVPSSQLYQPWLVALEGQFNVPKTPVIVGFKATKPVFSGAGQGDLRFYFGVKLDIGCIYKSFKGGTTPSFLQCSDDQVPASNTASNSPTSTPAKSNAPTTANGTTKTQ